MTPSFKDDIFCCPILDQKVNFGEILKKQNYHELTYEQKQDFVACGTYRTFFR